MRESRYFAALFSGEWSEGAPLEEGSELWLEAPEGVEGYGLECEMVDGETRSAVEPIVDDRSSILTIRTSIPFSFLQAVILYLYTSHISFLDSSKSRRILIYPPDSSTSSLPSPLPPLPIYLLAEYFDIPCLQSHAFEAYCSFLQASPTLEILTCLFDATIALHAELLNLVRRIASSAEIWAELEKEWTEERKMELGIEQERWIEAWSDVHRRVKIREEHEKRVAEEKEQEAMKKRTLANVWYG